MSREFADKERAKRIILEIIRQAGGRFQNKTNLYKAFWKAHLAYAENNPGYLSEWPIVKMPNGPGINDCDALLGELMAEGLLETDQIEMNGFKAFVFSTENCNEPGDQLPEEDIQAIIQGVEFVDGRTAASVSHDSHQLSRSWNAATSVGDELNVYMDLLSEEEYEASREKMNRLSREFRETVNRTT